MRASSAVGVLLVSSLLWAGRVLGDPPSGPTLSPADAARLEVLESTPLHKMNNHVTLAEYMRLRRMALDGRPLTPEAEIIHYALKHVGVPYKSGAHMFDLAQAGCVTWTERVIALGLTETWEDSYKLLLRMRYAGGDQSTPAKLNHYPLSDWVPNNSWLFEDITEQLGVHVAVLTDVTNRRQKYVEYLQSAGHADAPGAVDLPGEVSIQTPYVPAAELPACYGRLQSGDLAFFVADYPDQTDNVIRPRCIHEGIIYLDQGEVRILHSVQPAAANESLERFILKRIPRDRFLGIKFVRLRPNAREIVKAELIRAKMQSVPPAEKDRWLRTQGVLPDGTFLIEPSRPADEVVIINGRPYGAINLRPGDRLSKLLGPRWQKIYNLDVNAGFRETFPNPNILDIENHSQARILYPKRPDGSPSTGGN
jgi:hypothetical protein